MTLNSTFTDQELLINLRKGDRSAFDELYERHWDKVYNQAFKKLHDPDLAKDITQDVFIYLWTHKEGNFIDNLPAYLFSSVRNNVFKALKKEERFLPISDLVLKSKAFYSEADAELLQKEFFKTYNSLIQAMPAAQQNIYRMRYEQDLSTTEIAAQLNISRKTVQNQLIRAVNMLRASLVTIAFLMIQK
ncbi:RNA polymerase sigma factor [Pedobacter frigoris]|uniref:Sigma-70 family RNA polymerase sigma factor n=1 Tax=Pedobacter frigoris TaxID=2571272 RepID=A0A4U1CUI3_9SPHI|nr:sigma-70 family RNA polymerase sigma factor [Pedobacter frigoris]TKC09679.1 sigma-70 family RNA polymerase sigma factor [Pedobacter frigoris]